MSPGGGVRAPAPWLAAVVLLLAACTSGRGPGDGPVGVGSRAPDFELPTLNGETVRLADLRGKVVFVNFWATWCAPCRDEMPSMEVLKRQLEDREFAMVAISVDQEEGDIREFLASIPHSYDVVIDAAGNRGKLGTLTAQAYGITGVPETFVIDENGFIVEKVVGAADWADPRMFDYFHSLVSGPS